MSWPSQNNQDWHWLLVARENLTQTPEPIRRFLGALVKAEDFLLDHEDEAKGIIMRKWGFDPEFMREDWDKTRLNVSLNQSLVTSLENFAKWRMNKEGKAGNRQTF